jgi:hypothetical protein
MIVINLVCINVRYRAMSRDVQGHTNKDIFVEKQGELPLVHTVVKEAKFEFEWGVSTYLCPGK